jgi:hypothetical protein
MRHNSALYIVESSNVLLRCLNKLLLEWDI